MRRPPSFWTHLINFAFARGKPWTRYFAYFLFPFQWLIICLSQHLFSKNLISLCGKICRQCHPQCCHITYAREKHKGCFRIVRSFEVLRERPISLLWQAAYCCAFFSRPLSSFFKTMKERKSGLYEVSARRIPRVSRSKRMKERHLGHLYCCVKSACCPLWWARWCSKSSRPASSFFRLKSESKRNAP